MVYEESRKFTPRAVSPTPFSYLFKLANGPSNPVSSASNAAPSLSIQEPRPDPSIKRLIQPYPTTRHQFQVVRIAKAFGLSFRKLDNFFISFLTVRPAMVLVLAEVGPREENSRSQVGTAACKEAAKAKSGPREENSQSRVGAA